MRTFPQEFLFGAASSAYQIEGATQEDGKGVSVWDDFCSRKGKVRDGSTGKIACDHYHRWEEDLDIAEAMGLEAWRFSVSWSRILPDGRGSINQKGLDFYSRLVDGLLKRGIQPFPTLFHWDLPLALQKEMGGFTNREIISYFADYTRIVAQTLGDRAKTWITVNEPFEYSCFGHFFGTHAPGLHSPGAYLKAMHHVLMSHGEAVRVIRAEVPGAKIGPALSWTPIHPVSDSKRDKAAALRVEAFMNGITFDPILKGRYPETATKGFFFRLPVREGDMEKIAEPVDFVGVNYYSRERAKANPFVPFIGADVSGKEVRDVPETDERTAMGWEVYHEGLSEILTTLRTEYGNPPVYVSEFGSAWSDHPVDKSDGSQVHDERRVTYLASQLVLMHQALEKGSKLLGCFVWSFMDNFEWAEGLTKRFGIVYVDYVTQKRIVKESGHWYARVIASRTLDDGGSV